MKLKYWQFVYGCNSYESGTHLKRVEYGKNYKEAGVKTPKDFIRLVEEQVFISNFVDVIFSEIFIPKEFENEDVLFKVESLINKKLLEESYKLNRFKDFVIEKYNNRLKLYSDMCDVRQKYQTKSTILGKLQKRFKSAFLR